MNTVGSYIHQDDHISMLVKKCDGPNLNGHIYDLSDVCRAFNERLNKSPLLVRLGDEIAGIVKRFWVGETEETSKNVYVSIKVMDTRYGKLLKKFMEEKALLFPNIYWNAELSEDSKKVKIDSIERIDLLLGDGNDLKNDTDFDTY